MGDIRQLQGQHREWANHNFPDAQPHEPLLGIAEEVGELAHAHLKHVQGIRGYTEEKYRAEASDALGDLFVYMMSYANKNDFDLEACCYDTWYQVKQRNWVDDPETGGIT